MDAKQIGEIARERLDSWQKRLVAEHATPVVLIGVGHDHKCGQIVLCATEDGFTNAQLAELLRFAAAQLEE